MIFKRAVKKILALCNLQIIKLDKLSNNERLLSAHLMKMDYILHDNVLYLKKLNLKINITKHFFIVEQLEKLLELKKMNDAVLVQKDHLIYIHINELIINIQTGEEVLILHEVFIKGIYNFQTSYKFIVVDVGMNVAITSLYYSSFKNVLKVYSFEPFLPTFDQAIKNIELNLTGNKIVAKNFGLGASDQEITLAYDPIFKGSMGINSIPDYIPKSDTLNQEKILLKSAGPVLKSIINNNKNQKILLKIDCEGSEYDIVENLAENALLSSFHTIIIEWHIKGPEKIVKILNDNNFDVFSFDPMNLNIGMLYASSKS